MHRANVLRHWIWLVLSANSHCYGRLQDIVDVCCEFDILTEHDEIITQNIEKNSSLFFHIFSHFTYCNTLHFAAPTMFCYITLRFASLYNLQLYIVQLHFTFCGTLHFTTLHCVTLLYVLLHFTFCGPTGLQCTVVPLSLLACFYGGAKFMRAKLTYPICSLQCIVNLDL